MVVMINATTACDKNGAASKTYGFINAELNPRTIPHAANAAIGIIKLRPRAEKKSMILFFLIKLFLSLFRRYNYFNSGHMPLFASINASNTLRAFFASFTRRLNVNASNAF